MLLRLHYARWVAYFSRISLQDASAYDPRVVEQLMNFMYRYTAEVMQDAEVSDTVEGLERGLNVW